MSEQYTKPHKAEERNLWSTCWISGVHCVASFKSHLILVNARLLVRDPGLDPHVHHRHRVQLDPGLAQLPEERENRSTQAQVRSPPDVRASLRQLLLRIKDGSIGEVVVVPLEAANLVVPLEAAKLPRSCQAVVPLEAANAGERGVAEARAGLKLAIGQRSHLQQKVLHINLDSIAVSLFTNIRE